MFMMNVCVQNAEGQPLMPCHPARARQLRQAGRARIVRYRPFTIQLMDRSEGATQPTRLKLDPGSKTTGLALVTHFEKRGRHVIWAGELHHRGDQIRKRLADRRSLRRSRRSRKIRHRAPRFNNRSRPQGWLPPSIQSRVDNGYSWATRLTQLAPISDIDIETVRFDVHAMTATQPLSGVAYQQGTLQGWELREYLLYRHNHTCAYCMGERGDCVLEVDHITPKSRGGSDRVANLVIACRSCNLSKRNQTAQEWADRLKKSSARWAVTCRSHAEGIAQGQRPNLKDAAALNASRYALGRALQSLGIPVNFWSGGRTKANRSHQGYPKAHWIDAACVGDTGLNITLDPQTTIAVIKATGRGQRQTQRVDRFGFPRGAAGRVKRVEGLQTGDLALLVQPRGRYAGAHVGRIAGVRADGRMDLQTTSGLKITAPAKRLSLLQRSDGYQHENAKSV